jgi:hypothetical protein
MLYKLKNMKLLFIYLLTLTSAFAHAQRGGLTVDELKKLAGTWTGSFTYTDYVDDTTKTTIPARLEIAVLGDSLTFNYTFSLQGNLNKEYGGLRYLKQADQINIDGEAFYIAAVRRKGVRLTVIAEMESNDNGKEAIIRKSITIGPSNLIFVKEVKYNSAKDFFVRNKLELQKMQ